MRKLALFLLMALPCAAAYQPYFTGNMWGWQGWQLNGNVQANYGTLFSWAADGGSLISVLTPPDGTPRYEVKSQLNLPSSGGTYVHYLRASLDAVSGPTPAGTYYAIELQNPTFGTDGQCSATLAAYKRVGGVITALGSAAAPCSQAPVMRSVHNGTRILSYVDDQLILSVADSSITDGKPGVGGRAMPVNNFIGTTYLGPLDTVAPPSISASLGVSAFSNRVELQWRAGADDPNGSGVYSYTVYRDNALLFTDVAESRADDTTVSPGTTYSYRIDAVDFHGNTGTATISVTTPSSATIDPRRFGVRPTGAYWGGGGEQIDVRSGNLNFTVPFFKVAGRNGAGMQFVLSYNSQFWRKDANGTWFHGRDLGLGLGWRLMVGAILPVYGTDWNVHHYLYTDSSGAEYRLDVNDNGVWRGTEGVYVYYNPSQRRLYFPDGSYWILGAVSGGQEDDAGTLYPTEVRDSNGNQILLSYKPGTGAGFANSSSRLYQVTDVTNSAYTLTYSDEARPRLTSVLGSGVNYALTYNTAYPVYEPYTGQSTGLSTRVLSSITNGAGQVTTFNTDAGGSGELRYLQLPQQGCVGWNYASLTQASIQLRQVNERYLSAGTCSSGFTWHYLTIDNSSATGIPAWTKVRDGTAQSEKLWNFEQSAANSLGLVTRYAERSYPAAVEAIAKSYTWARSSTNQPYISTSITQLDPGQSSAVSSKTTQVVDAYGNVTETKLFGYGNNSTTADRTYSTTYLATSAYTSRFIFNRPLVSTLNAGGQNYTLASNSYDAGYLQDVANLTRHATSEYPWNFTYRGNVTSSTAMSGTQTMTYDLTGTAVTVSKTGQPSVTQTPAAGTNNAVPGTITPNSESNLAVSYTWTGFLGLSSVSGANGFSASITYDGLTRPQTTTTATGATTTYAYTATTTKATTNGHWTMTTVDGLGRTIKTETGYGTTTVSVVETEYAPCACSPMGKVSRVSMPHAPGATAVWTTYNYDVMGRTTSVTAPDGSTTTYAYVGNTLTVTDPAGKWKKYTNDAFGNLVEVVEPKDANNTYTTSYTYNVFNKLTLVTMPRDGVTQTRSFVYDSAQQLQSVTNPESGTTTYSYTPYGRLEYKVDAAGNRVEYNYDAYNRLTQKRQYAPGPVEDTCRRVDYYWDQNSFDTPQYWGKLNAVKYGGVTCRAGQFIELYRYSSAGLTTRKEIRYSKRVDLGGGNYWDAPGSLVGTFEYNNEGVLTALTYPNGERYYYTLDSMSRPTKLTSDVLANDGNRYATDWAKDAVYGVAGELTQWKHVGGGMVDAMDRPNFLYYTETRQYNNRMQMTRLTATHPFSTSSMDLEYRYDTTGHNNGQIASMKDYVTGEEINYTYDTLNRLTRAETVGPEWGQSYTFDGFGNLLAQSVTKGSAPAMSLTVSGTTNRITTSGFSYYANGNMATMPQWSGSYDKEGRLVDATHSLNGSESYEYDASGLRIWDSTTGAIVFYGPGGQRLANCPFTGMQYGSGFTFGCKPITYFAGQVVTGEGDKTASGNWGRATDRLGSTRAAPYGYNQWNQGVTASSYFPYGQARTGGSVFASYLPNTTTSTMYAMNREYSAVYGRFLTPDPYQASGGPADPGSWNRYAYVVGDPANLRDPSGLENRPTWCDVYPDDPKCAAFKMCPDGNVVLANGDCSSSQTSGGEDRSRERRRAVVERNLPRAMREAYRRLTNPDCLAFLSDGKLQDINPIFVLGRIDAGQAGRIEIDDIPDEPNQATSATTKVILWQNVPVKDGLQLQATQVLITINDLTGTFVNGNVGSQSTTILHELAHAIYDLYGPNGKGILDEAYGIQPDGTNVKLSEDNTAKINRNCH